MCQGSSTKIVARTSAACGKFIPARKRGSHVHRSSGGASAWGGGRVISPCKTSRRSGYRPIRFVQTCIDRKSWIFRRNLCSRMKIMSSTLASERRVVRIWLDPSIRSIYFARSTLLELARQYWRYGYWKWRMLRRYPDTLRWRQALPPLFVLSLIGLVLFRYLSRLLRFILAGECFVYLFVMFLAGLQSALRLDKPYLLFGLPLAIPVMHYHLGKWVFMEYPHVELQARMAENIRTTPLRLRPSEHRAILFIGDLLMSVVSVFAALYTWRQYNPPYNPVAGDPKYLDHGRS